MNRQRDLEEKHERAIQAVLLDLDGTLIDTPKGIVVAFEAAMKALGEFHVKETDIRATIGLPLQNAWGKLLGKDPSDALVAEGIRYYQTFFKELVLPKAGELVFPGVREGLVQLTSQGVGLALVTNKFYASAKQVVHCAELHDYFHVVVGADQVAHPKPHPEMGYLALRALAVKPDQAVMVGDTTHDMQMAKNIPMRSIATTYGVHSASQLNAENPTWVAHNFGDVVLRILTHVRVSETSYGQ